MVVTVTEAIDLEAVNLMLALTMVDLPPTLVSEPSGDAAPWAIWDLPDVLRVCGRLMSVQVTFTRPSRGEVEVQAISMYPTPEGRTP